MATHDSDPAALVERLVSNHRLFLDFLERRTSSRADAEDVLQDAFVRVMEKGEKGAGPRRSESAVAWFYRLLRNALVDRLRGEGARGRLLVAAAEEGDSAPEVGLREEVCRCIRALLPSLKPAYRDLILRVDLGGEPVHAAASALGITANLASVRLHRARKALFREVQRSCGSCATHGCLDCTCGPSEAAGGCGD